MTIAYDLSHSFLDDGYELTRDYYSNKLDNLNSNLKFDDFYNKTLNYFKSDDNPYIKVLSQSDDLEEYQKIAEKLKNNATDILFLGTGGSSLAGQAFARIVGHGMQGAGEFLGFPRYHFIDNFDLWQIKKLLNNAPTEGIRVVITSKSGGTLETVLSLGLVIQKFEEENLTSMIKDNFIIITDPMEVSANPLRKFAADYGVKIFDHVKDIGGRYSAFTNVGLIPAAFFGLDLQKIREGGLCSLDFHLSSFSTMYSLQGAIWHYWAYETLGIKSSTFMAYNDRMRKTLYWIKQLWAESLGKDGKGLTPITAIGPVDQHSQLQLFLGGAKDKTFTIINVNENIPEEVKLGDEFDHKYLADRFNNRDLRDFLKAQFNGVADSLVNHQVPTRKIVLSKLDEFNLGVLMFNLVIETILTGWLLGVNPFDQPAVEGMKKLTLDHFIR